MYIEFGIVYVLCTLVGLGLVWCYFDYSARFRLAGKIYSLNSNLLCLGAIYARHLKEYFITFNKNGMQCKCTHFWFIFGSIAAKSLPKIGKK